MTEETPSPIGTVAQEAARLIEDMATMARSGYNRPDDTGRYAGEPAPEPGAPEARDAQDVPDAEYGGQPAGDRHTGDPRTGARPAADHQGADESSGVCSMCGADGDDTPASCRICPLCRGIALLRSVRPETVELLAELALSVAAGLRDVASRSRASAPQSPPSQSQSQSPPQSQSQSQSKSKSKPGSGGPAGGDRSTVQDIHVDDESE